MQMKKAQLVSLTRATSRNAGNHVQKKAQLVHWTDESDFQETRGSRDMIFVMIISDNKQA